MSLKLLGAVIILLSSCCLGICSGVTMKKRIELIKGFVWSLAEFKALLKFIYETIPDACMKISDNCNSDVVRKLYRQVGEKLDKKGDEEFKTIWLEAVDKILCNSCLENSDIKIISKMSELPIFLDRDALINKITSVEDEMDMTRVNAEKHIKEQCRVYGCTGFCAGVIAVILLI